MKRLFLIVLLTMSFACENNDVKKAVDYSKVISSLDQIHTNTLNYVLTSAKNSNKDVAGTTLDYLQTNYYKGNIDLSSTINAKISSVENDELKLDFLTAAQRTFARPFLEDVLAQDEMVNVNNIVLSFEGQVTNSTLSTEQKYQLLSMASLIKQGCQIIREAQAGLLNSKIKGEISPKDALRAGVEGLLAGAVYGAYTGATAGTMTFPVVGTVVGTVSCAVVGGAVGFVSGVVGSIASQLFWN